MTAPARDKGEWVLRADGGLYQRAWPDGSYSLTEVQAKATRFDTANEARGARIFNCHPIHLTPKGLRAAERAVVDAALSADDAEAAMDAFREAWIEPWTEESSRESCRLVDACSDANARLREAVDALRARRATLKNKKGE